MPSRVRSWLTLLLVSLYALSLSSAAYSQSQPLPSETTVEIVRDRYGVPHIYASDVYSLFYGYGYAVAQDRLFQMEIAKRTFTGRLAEVLGPAYARIDIETVRNFIPETIERQINALKPEEYQILKGYVDGINAYIDLVLKNRNTLLPREFIEYRFDPEPWTVYDLVMIFVGSMAHRYGDFNSELANLALLRFLEQKHGKEKGRLIFNQLLWLSDPKAPTTTHGPVVNLTENKADVDYLTGEPSLSAAMSESLFDPPAASNIIVVGRNKAKGARAILMNGPQFGNFVPAYVYGVGLHGAGFDVVGNTPFAYPVILFGHNQDIAWGATAGPNDVVDIYEEKLHPNDDNLYLYNGSYQPMRKYTRTIYVRDSSPVTVDVYTTIHGIVISRDLKNRVAYAKKRSWEGLEVKSLMAWIKSMKARSFAEWKEAAAEFALPINWFYADRLGNIGYISNGRLPIRPQNQPYNLPAKGTGDMEWLGFYSIDKNPQVYNPDSGIIINWNNKPSPDFLNNDSWYFSFADRSNEMFTLVHNKAGLDAKDVQEVIRRVSFVDVNVRYYMPYLERIQNLLKPGSLAYTALNAIKEWYKNGYTLVDADDDGFFDDPGAAIFQTWLQRMLSNTLGDELDGFAGPARSFGLTISRGASLNLSIGSRVLVNALLGKDSGVPQVYDFFNGENPDNVVHRSLLEAVDILAKTYGNDVTKWKLPAAAHVFQTNNFVGAPQTTPNMGFGLPTYMNRGTENNLVILSEEGIYSFDVTPPGQSGFVAPDGEVSKHYYDQVGLYLTFRLKPQFYYRKDVLRNAVSIDRIVILRP